MRVEIKGTIVPNDDKWIYDWLGMDATCPRDVQKIMDTAMGQGLDVFINSGGGDIFAGSEIYAALGAYVGKVSIHVVGLAASAASVILCAGKSDIAPTGLVMVHNASSRASGDYHDMDKSSEILQQANRSIAAAYITKTGKSELEVLALMDRETWLTAKDAVEYGFVDSIIEPSGQLVASYGATVLPRAVIDQIKDTVKNPLAIEADILLQKAQAELELISFGGIR